VNSFGRVFRVSIYGESHGSGVGIIVDGCPAGIKLTDDDFEKDLSRRRAGAAGTTPRVEQDKPEFLSGFFNGHTTGSPLNMFFRNTNTKSEDYNRFQDHPRPGHADYSSMQKYGPYGDPRGSGHFSGRITTGLVAAGTVARKVCSSLEISAELIEAGGSSDIEKAVSEAVLTENSIGGIICCRINGVPSGLGEPFFNSTESVISHIVFSVPGVRGLEFGSGFKSASMKGSEHNDRIIASNGETETNNHSGINGGITNGNEIYFRAAMKPTSTISLSQVTYNFKENKMMELEGKGRHDICFALRVPVVIESAAAIALADLYLLSKSLNYKGEEI
jgi:chorismate synthase